MLQSEIIEKKDIHSLSYVLQNAQMFFQTGYKVLQSQEKNGFIRCTRIIFNGNDKLIYDISKYKSLEILLPNITCEVFISIIKNLIDAIIDVNSNGFMQYKNIEIDFDKVFVDCNNYKVYLIYLPINSTSSSDDYMVFEKQLKNNLINAAIKYPNISNSQLQGMLQSIKSDMTSIEVIKEKISNISNSLNSKVLNTNGLSDITGASLTNVRESHQSPVINSAVDTQPQKKKKLGFFSKRKEKCDTQQQNVAIQSQCEGGATEILDDVIYKDIKLVGLNTPIDFQAAVSKQEFLIGKRADSVDACINFNTAISRVHCKIITSNNEHYIVDLGSANGTYVNGYKLNINQQMPIKAGDIIKLANSEFVIK